MSVLLLNADAQPLSLIPLSTISWQNAVKAYFADKIKIVKSYDDRLLRSANFEMPMPSVVMLNKYHKLPNKAKFTRRNMFIRDHFTCQYCGTRHRQLDLTIDHVVPRSHGGRTTWTNCTTACRPCNVAKSNKINITPEIQPFQPSYYEINHKSALFTLRIPDASWRDFLAWPEDLVDVDKSLIISA